jgi:hypothetical protein
MSQGSAKRVDARAIFAATAVCALIFSLFVSGAMQGAHAAGSMRMAVGATTSCHHLEASALTSTAAPDHHKGGHSGKVDCPFCCLAAHAGAVVLPDRLATFVRPLRIPSSRVLYSALSTHEPEIAASNAVNGARAPPAKHFSS